MGSVSDIFRLLGDPVFEGPRVRIGFGVSGLPEMTIPGTIRQSAIYKELGLEIELWCELSESRLEVREIKIAAREGVLATTLLTQLKLPQVLRKIGLNSINNVDFYLKELRRQTDNRIADDALIAQIYALEYACWGSPRDTLMKYMGWSRTNTNLHLRRISQTFPLPGPQRLPKPTNPRARNKNVLGKK